MASTKLVTVFGATGEYQVHLAYSLEDQHPFAYCYLSYPKWSLTLPLTGNQGGAVARSLLKNKNFSVRGTTRNPDSDAAMALTSLGAEMVKADGFNKDEMKEAFNGSWGAFVNTQSDDPVINILSNIDSKITA